MSPTAPLEDLIHDVNSKCASLRDGARLLRSSTPAESAGLLRLMTQQAQSLAETISAFEKSSAGR